MTRLSWDDLTQRNFEQGVDRGVFYSKVGIGYPWSGLISVDESTTDIGQSLIYIDGVGHQNQLKIGSFIATVSAITYPKEFEPYSAQTRFEFNFTYRTLQTNGHYKIHLVYNALTAPITRNNSSINAGSDIEPFVWDLTTRSEIIQGARPSSHFVIDSRFVYPGVIAQIESLLYGDDIADPTMPTVSQLLEFFDAHAILRITDHGDGTWTAEGPDDVVKLLDATTFQIDWSSAIFTTEDAYTVRTL